MCSENAAALYRHPLPDVVLPRRGRGVHHGVHPDSRQADPRPLAREELVLLARALWREGYNDHLAGHITLNLGDGTLLCNPWLLTWDEIRPEQVLRITSTATWSRATGRSRSASHSISSCTSCART